MNLSLEHRCAAPAGFRLAGISATRLASDAGRRVHWVTLALVVLAAAVRPAPAAAAGLELLVVDPSGHGVPDVVIVVTAASPPPASSAGPAPTAIMDQQNRAFVPQVLVVRTGTVVAFPNNDTVSHQVYSFSPARRFQLSLYKGEAHTPITFNAPGLVVLGCNIHDQMVGYIFVTDSPYFAKTDANGSAVIQGLPAGSYHLDVWGPRVADKPADLAADVTIAGSETISRQVRLLRPLRPRPSPGPKDDDWDY
jgi:plastocyanin